MAHPLTTYWLAALSEPKGIWLRSPTPEASLQLKNLLYTVRNQQMDEGTKLACRNIQIRTSPTNPRHELWMVNVPAPEPEPDAEG